MTNSTTLKNVVPLTGTSRLLDERGKTHGDYHRTAEIAQKLKDFARAQPEWDRKNYKERESIDQAATKLARMISGDASHPDHMADIDGYQKLSEGLG